VLLCVAVTASHAEPAAPERYPIRIVIADVASVGIVLGGIALFADGKFGSENPASGGDVAAMSVLVLGGGLSYIIAPAVLHGLRGNRSGCVSSIAARVLIPLFAGVGGYAVSGEDAATKGVLVGAASAMVLDWTMFAKLQPTVAVAGGGVQVGLAGTF
jgi:hypothetical protein